MLRHPGNMALMFLAFGLVLFFGFKIVSADLKTKEDNKNSEEKTEIAKSKKIDLEDLNSNQKAELSALNEELQKSNTVQSKIEILKKISSFCYALKKFESAGDYAAKVAELSNTADSWGIAGTTYLAGVSDESVPESKLSCKEKAILSLTKAISLEPTNPQHKMNLGLCSVILPGDNPMEGILQLLEVDKEFPEYIPAQIVLSQLAIQTGQWEKAFNRLNRILLKEPNQEECKELMKVVKKGLEENKS